MNRPPDVELVLRAYLADTGDRAPDRVLTDVAARIAHHPRRAGRLRGRPFMNTYTKLAAAAAAVLVVGIVGWQLLPRTSGPGGPSTMPSPSPVPQSAVPTARAGFPEWYTARSPDGAGILPAGNATTTIFLRGSTFTVPAGWVNGTDSSEFFSLFPDSPANEAEFGRSGELAQSVFMGVVDTPSGMICEGIDATGATAAALVDSLVANNKVVTSNRVDVTIGGLSGTRVDTRIDPASAGACSTDYRGRFVFLDTSRGKLLIIIDSLHAADFDTYVAEAMPIVESFQFTIGP